jgi:uncharacterized protein (TIGR00290 family)
LSTRVALSWSGGKDSALALLALRQDPAVDVACLVTSVTTEYDRVSVHGVRRSLLREQANRLGLPLFEVPLPSGCTNAAYEAAFLEGLREMGRGVPGVAAVAFGDLFLEDVRAYRERLLAGSGFAPLFPVWGRETALLADEFVRGGFAARVVCVDCTLLDPSFAGRAYDASLLSDLPHDVDPCGERGEFHTFVSDGPGFSAPVAYRVGTTVMREGRFMFCDLE